MPRAALALLLVIALGGVCPPPADGQTDQVDQDLVTGIRQVREGELDAALITLDGVVNRLLTEKGWSKALARAYTYLAIAYVGLAQQEKAKAQFVEAWRADNSLRLSPDEFPPSVIEFFERARREGQEQLGAETREGAQPPQAPRLTPVAQPLESRRGGSRLPLFLLGGSTVVGGAIALAVGGGTEDTGGTENAPPPPTRGPMTITGRAGYVAGVLSDVQQFLSVFVGAWGVTWRGRFCTQTLGASDGSFALEVPATCFAEGETVYLTAGGLTTCVTVAFRSSGLASVELLGRREDVCR